MPDITTDAVALDLNREIEQLQLDPRWETGQSAKVLVKHETLQVVLMALKADARMPEHQAEGRISIQTLRGHIRVHAGGRAFALPAGTLLALEQRVRHDVEALEDSVFLLTIAREHRTHASAL